MNTPVAIAQLFDGVKYINLLSEGKEMLTESDLLSFKHFMNTVTKDIFGIKKEQKEYHPGLEDELIELIINLRLEARKNKDFKTSDKIRDHLAEMGIVLNDAKDGTKWERS
ncbi:Cysteine--tRNA ligase [subsurface metagenome]